MNLIETNCLDGDDKSNKLFYLYEKINGKNCKVLIDCGSSENCISERFSIQIGITIQEIKEDQIILVNGRKKKFLRYFKILSYMNGYREKFKLTIVVL